MNGSITEQINESMDGISILGNRLTDEWIYKLMNVCK